MVDITNPSGSQKPFESVPDTGVHEGPSLVERIKAPTMWGVVSRIQAITCAKEIKKLMMVTNDEV